MFAVHVSTLLIKRSDISSWVNVVDVSPVILHRQIYRNKPRHSTRAMLLPTARLAALFPIAVGPLEIALISPKSLAVLYRSSLVLFIECGIIGE